MLLEFGSLFCEMCLGVSRRLQTLASTAEDLLQSPIVLYYVAETQLSRVCLLIKGMLGKLVLQSRQMTQCM